jgi:hypothetical protein
MSKPVFNVETKLDSKQIISPIAFSKQADPKLPVAIADCIRIDYDVAWRV